MARLEDNRHAGAPRGQALAQLLAALPVSALLVSPGGALIDGPSVDIALSGLAGERADDGPVIDYVWELPAFSDMRDRAGLFRLLGRAQDGETVQVERPYTAPGRKPERRRGLLSLTPLLDEDGLVDLIALTLIDCEDHALPVLGPRDPARIQAAQSRVEGVLDLAQAVIETSYALEAEAPSGRSSRRDALSERLHRCGACADALCQLDTQQVAMRDVLKYGLEPDAMDCVDRASSTDTVPIALVPALSLLLAELAANAAAHGAWSRTGGRVELALRRSSPGTRPPALVLDWAESGLQDLQPPQSSGFGLRFMQDVLPRLYGAEAKLDARPDGYRWTLTLPLGTQSGMAAGTPLREFGRFDGGFSVPDGRGADLA